MQNLKRSGKLARAKAVVVGYFNKMKFEKEWGADAEALINAYTASLGVPVIFGFPAGHASPNMSLSVGTGCRSSSRPRVRRSNSFDGKCPLPYNRLPVFRSCYPFLSPIPFSAPVCVFVSVVTSERYPAKVVAVDGRRFADDFRTGTFFIVVFRSCFGSQGRAERL